MPPETPAGTPLDVAVLESMETYSIDNSAAAGALTVRAIPAGVTFAVLHLYVEAEAATDITVRSGTTDLSGPIRFEAAEEKEWRNAPFPVFTGRATGDDFVLNISAAVQVQGWANIVEQQT